LYDLQDYGYESLNLIFTLFINKTTLVAAD